MSTRPVPGDLLPHLRRARDLADRKYAERPHGVEAVIRDNSGNWLVIVEPREFDPSATQ